LKRGGQRAGVPRGKKPVGRKKWPKTREGRQKLSGEQTQSEGPRQESKRPPPRKKQKHYRKGRHLSKVDIFQVAS